MSDRGRVAELSRADPRPTLLEHKRILLIRLSHLGDVVHALPVYHALRNAYPEARLAWVTQPEFAGLVRGLPGLERTFLFGRREGARAWPRLAAEISQFAPNWVIDAQGNAKSAAAAMCAGPARRSGLHPLDWRESLAALCLNDWAPRVPSRSGHAMDRMIALARYVGGADAAPRCDPALTSDERLSGRTELNDRLEGADASTLTILQLSTPADVRSWPPEHFATLARLLVAKGRTVLLLSGPGEAAIGTQLRERLGDGPSQKHWVGQRGLRELASLFSAAAEQPGARFVGCDSGPMHLAGACGLRVVCLSGPQSHRRTGPWPIGALARSDEPPPVAASFRHRVLRADPEPDCAPCYKRSCSHARGPVCMSDLSPDRVAAALV